MDQFDDTAPAAAADSDPMISLRAADAWALFAAAALVNDVLTGVSAAEDLPEGAIGLGLAAERPFTAEETAAGLDTDPANPEVPFDAIVDRTPAFGRAMAAALHALQI